MRLLASLSWKNLISIIPDILILIQILGSFLRIIYLEICLVQSTSSSIFLVIYKLLETDLKFETLILRSSLLRYESFFSIDNERRWIFSSVIVFIYSNMFILNSRFLLCPIIHTLLNNLVDSQKKKKKIPEKENNPAEVFTVFAKDSVGKRGMHRVWNNGVSVVRGSTDIGRQDTRVFDRDDTQKSHASSWWCLVKP